MEENEIFTDATERGFGLYEFTDYYGNTCSLQESSIATEPCLWLGLNQLKAEIMASQAKSLGIDTTQTTGWIPYPIPSEVSTWTRMHLDYEGVQNLVTRLQLWLTVNGEVQP